jgi:hypothetical protein
MIPLLGGPDDWAMPLISGMVAGLLLLFAGRP